MRVATCRACGDTSLEPTSSAWTGATLVTSDCRPWPRFSDCLVYVCGTCGLAQKEVDLRFKEETRRIYETYASYAQGDGKEQSVFSADGSGQKRSEQILDYLHTASGIPDTGTLLDFGCGAGNFLRSFRSRRPGWRLFGSDYGESGRAAIEAISGTTYLLGPLDRAGVKFDLIVAIHVMEHMEDPLSVLALLQDALAEGGRLLIQVPNLRQSPFDVLIADHCSHFSVKSLTGLVGRSGFALSGLSDNVVPKEITAVLTPAVGGSGASEAAVVDGHIDLLERFLRTDLEGVERLGVFGSSIAASWLVGELPAIAFFVDEDPDRIGKEHLGRPIVAPGDVPAGSVVLLPMNPILAKRIAARLGSESFRFVIPE